MVLSRAAWILGAGIAWPGVLCAQVPPSTETPKSVAVQHETAATDERARLDLKDSTVRVPDTFSFGGLKIDGVFQSDTTRTVAGFGPAWQASAAVTYHLPAGITVSAALIGRRGYQLPLFMTTPAGGETAVASPATALAPTARVPVLWDTRLRVERRLFTTRIVSGDAVVEGLNLFNVNPSHDASAITSALTSRILRAGLSLRF